MTLPIDLESNKMLILVFLDRWPGVGLRQLARGIDRKPHQVQRAVAELEEEGQVVTFRFRNKVCHFLNREDHVQNRRTLALLAQVEGLQDLYDHIATHPGLRQHEILAWAMDRGWARSTTYWRLNELVRHALVHEQRGGGGVTYQMGREDSPV